MGRRSLEPDEPARDVGSFIAGLSGSHLECRELGHLWRPWRATLGDDGQTYERVLRCSRCKTERVQLLSLYGHVLRNGYNYADGYTSHGLGRMVGEDRDALRLESLTRFIERKGTGHA